uniref:SEFIR domain-containing protein n=1 Tax=Amphilophus citrinellus TaxID=61819 RepID=A0A3Q0QU82_AMPCI
APSLVADFKLEKVTVAGEVMLNISWAINIDASNKYLDGTRIVMMQQDYHCEYDPPFASAHLNNLSQIWFHYLRSTGCGNISVQVANLPLPPVVEGTFAYKVSNIEISCSKQSKFLKNVYKRCRSNTGTLLYYKKTPLVPVPVLVIYPAVNSSFQQAVVAFAEFLHWHGGCRVAIDIWQQEKIAQQGPMRWLAEQAKSADRVLIVSPQVETPGHCLPDPTLPEASIPAAAHDLYPLILNMVACHAKSASELAKFWVVQLGEQQDKSSCMLPLELRVCQSFCLMKDLTKLCKHLHALKQNDKKILNLLCRRGVSYSEKNTLKLRETVEKLRGHQVNVSREVSLNSVVTTI